jgi:glutathione synthase/RimK-type ligase-like ATP-grasp enzyme
MAAMSRAGLETALRAIEARMGPGAGADLRCERALILASLGRTEAARRAYLEILQQDPTHFAALNNFGTLLAGTNYRTAARTLFEQAVTCHPREPVGHVNLADLLARAGDTRGARGHYETALRLDPGNAPAHQRLGELLMETGEVEAARRHRRQGFGAEPVQTLAFVGRGEPIDLLVLTSTPAGDVAWRKLVDEQVFRITTLAAAFLDSATPLPPHALILNAIGDADVSAEDLEAAEAICARSGAPVINPPARCRASGRQANAARLGALPCVTAPRIATLPRRTLSGPDGREALRAEGLTFPLLLRSPGFHTGRHFVRVEQPEDMAGAVAGLPGPELMALQYLDAQGADGFSRKYRVMLIGGRLYPLHLVISQDWKAHYFSGAMADRPDFRAEEARFLAHMPGVLGARAMAALEAIQTALGLDYGGVDFALGPTGELLLFEANATMNIVPPDAAPVWDYRRSATDAALAAARAMLADLAGATCRRPTAEIG